MQTAALGATVKPDLYSSCMVASHIENGRSTSSQYCDALQACTARNLSRNQRLDISEKNRGKTISIYKQQRITTPDSQIQNRFYVVFFNLKLYTRAAQYVSTDRRTLQTPSQVRTEDPRGPSIAVVVGFEGSFARQTQVLGLFL